MTIHSDPCRETDVKQHRMHGNKDGNSKGVRSIGMTFGSGHIVDLGSRRVHAGKTVTQILTGAPNTDLASPSFTSQDCSEKQPFQEKNAASLGLIPEVIDSLFSNYLIF